MIFNPFEKLSEKSLLILSAFSTLAAIGLGYCTNTYFSSIYRVSYLDKISLQDTTVHALISFAAAIAVLFILGKIFNRKTRFIDISNTVLISQLPLLVLFPFQKIEFITAAQKTIFNYQANPALPFPAVSFIIFISFTLLIITLLIYSMVLYYNGFKTATNIRKWQSIVIFTIVSFLTILICQLINN